MGNIGTRGLTKNQVMMSAQPSSKLAKYKSPHPVKGPNDAIGAGDSRIVYNVISDLDEEGFSSLKNEVLWQSMHHAGGEVPRLVCCQGLIEQDGSIPVYRHPSDQSLPLLQFSPMINAIKDKVQEIVGHPMNHVLIQLYRGGTDFISEHSDKTLDIVRGSTVVNVSLGAQRTMRIRTKKSGMNEGEGRKTELVPMPHGSVFVLGLKTNEAWLHGINADKRLAFERSEEEKAFEGQRISLTFRNIGTFLSSDEKLIWGQGACGKQKEDAQPVVNGNRESGQDMINAFGMENQFSEFDWIRHYGSGFNVLHMHAPPEQVPLLFLSGKESTDEEVEALLKSAGLIYRVAGATRAQAGADYQPVVCLRMDDQHKTELRGVSNIVQYIREKRNSI